MQLAEAARLGLGNYEAPGGGCLLTDPAYARRLRDLLEHSPAGLDGAEVELLAVGRHFRCGPGLKIVLGCDAAENARLAAFADGDRWLIEPEDCAGPSALVCGPRGDGSLEQAAALVSRYVRAGAPGEPVRWRTADGIWERPLESNPTTPRPARSRPGAIRPVAAL